MGCNHASCNRKRKAKRSVAAQAQALSRRIDTGSYIRTTLIVCPWCWDADLHRRFRRNETSCGHCVYCETYTTIGTSIGGRKLRYV